MNWFIKYYLLLAFTPPLAYTSFLHESLGNLRERQALLESFATCLLEFMEPIKDRSLPAFSFYIQNDLHFYANYRLILDSEIHLSVISSPNNSSHRTGRQATITTIKNALLSYGIEETFRLFQNDPIIKEIFETVKLIIQLDHKVSLLKLSRLGGVTIANL